MKKNTLKKLLFGLSLVVAGNTLKAQNGLENVIVERYYVADANDAANSIGVLPVGSVTYRIFVDMLPGYKFEALYGVPGHTLNISTTTTFFNNEDRGALYPNLIGNQYWHNNSVALDSWLSVGGTSTGHVGVLKSTDDGVSNIVMPNSMLQNTTGNIGIPLTQQDGSIAGTPEAVTVVGIGNTGNGDCGVFDAISQVGGSFTTSNGSIASLNGSYGPDSLTNIVLVGQFTTDGDFCFSLNIQIGTPTPGVFENYLASPITDPYYKSFLNYCSNTVGLDKPKTPATSSIEVYPNPASNTVTIDLNSSEKVNSSSYRIIDMLGNVLADKTLGASSGRYTEKIDISEFSKGIYFIEIMQDGVKSTKKLIKY